MSDPVPNTSLIEKLLQLAETATLEERMVLKVAMGALKQIDPDYNPWHESDTRVQLTPEEWEWLPEKIELVHGVIPGWRFPET